MLENEVGHLQETVELSEANAEAAHIELVKVPSIYYVVTFRWGGRSKISRNVWNCPEMSRIVQNCPEMPRIAQNYPELSRNVQKCPELPRSFQVDEFW